MTKLEKIKVHPFYFPVQKCYMVCAVLKNITVEN